MPGDSAFLASRQRSRRTPPPGGLMTTTATPRSLGKHPVPRPHHQRRHLHHHPFSFSHSNKSITASFSPTPGILSSHSIPGTVLSHVVAFLSRCWVASIAMIFPSLAAFSALSLGVSAFLVLPEPHAIDDDSSPAPSGLDFHPVEVHKALGVQ